MNWKILALVLLTVVNAYKMLLLFVQYRSAGNPTPANVADVYDAETYLRWKNYNAEHCRLSMVSTVISYVLLLVLLLTNAHAWFAAFFPDTGFMQMAAVILLQTGVDAVVSVVISYVDTMVIEQKYGFNRTKMKTFLFDQLRGLILGLLLSCLIMGVFCALHVNLGNYVLVLFAGVMLLFTLFVSFLYPIFSRIGNKFTPLEDGPLKERLMELLNKHGYKVKAIEVMDASRRTTKLNAYFTGFGKLKTIVLYDNLVNAMSTEEICAVFAHELGHGLHKDVLKQQIMNFGNLLLMAVVVWLTVRDPRLHADFGFAEINYGFAYVLAGIGLGLTQPLSSMAMNAYSRFAEFRADRQAVQEGYGDAMITALKKLAKENFAHLAPSPICVVLEYSHPPLSQRIAKVEQVKK